MIEFEFKEQFKLTNLDVRKYLQFLFVFLQFCTKMHPGCSFPSFRQTVCYSCALTVIPPHPHVRYFYHVKQTQWAEWEMFFCLLWLNSIPASACTHATVHHTAVLQIHWSLPAPLNAAQRLWFIEPWSTDAAELNSLWNWTQLMPVLIL